MRGIVVEVVGTPATQGSKDFFGAGKPVEHSKTLRPWREAVKWAAYQETRRHDPWEPLDGPIGLTVTFYLRRPATLPKRVWAPHKGLDLDKLTRGVFDALTDANVWCNDSRVIDADIHKRYALNRPPGAVICVNEVEQP